LLDLVAVGLDGVMRTAFLGQRRVGPVDHDDFRSAQCGQHLNADVPETTGTDDHRVLSRQQMARRFLGCTVRRQSGIGVGRDILRRQRLGQLDERALAG